MATCFRSPVSRTFRPEDRFRELSRYSGPQQRSSDEFACMAGAFHDPVTGRHESGWSWPLPFAPGKEGESFEESIAGHRFFPGKRIRVLEADPINH